MMVTAQDKFVTLAQANVLIVWSMGTVLLEMFVILVEGTYVSIALMMVTAQLRFVTLDQKYVSIAWLMVIVLSENTVKQAQIAVWNA